VAARAEPTTSFGEVTIITAQWSGSVTLTLPHNALFRCSSNTSNFIRISGGGTLAFVVVQPASGRPGTVVAARVPTHPSQLLYSGLPDSCSRGSATLPSGAYRVFINPGGRPVTVIVALRGPSGTRSTTLTHAVTWSDAIWDQSGPSGYSSAGASRRMSRKGVIWVSEWIEGAAPNIYSAGLCAYKGNSEVPNGELEYRPGCPGSATTSLTVGTGRTIAMLNFASVTEPGVYSLGGYTSWLPARASFCVSAFWLETS